MSWTIISEKMLITGWLTILKQLKKKGKYHAVVIIYSNSKEPQRKSIFKVWVLKSQNQNMKDQDSQILGPTPDLLNKTC